MKFLFLVAMIFSSNAFAEIVSIKSDEVCVPETDDCISKLTIITNTSKIQLENLMGDFLLSKVNNQVFDCGGSVLRRMSHANIIEEDGAKKQIKHNGD
jgi:hypothetical protein